MSPRLAAEECWDHNIPEPRGTGAQAAAPGAGLTGQRQSWGARVALQQSVLLPGEPSWQGLEAPHPETVET